MNIEDLSKSQLLFLMIFVNFIVSIATGVLTVSLLDQAPTQVVETVNRIVDNTVQQVATGTPLSSIVAPPPQTITKTIIESNDDLLTAAVSAENARSVQIYDSSAGTTSAAVELGTYLPEARAVVTDTLSTLPADVIIVFPDGSSLPASLSHSGATITIYGFSDSATLPKAPTPKIVASTDLQQGQTAVSLTADGSAVTGIVSKIDTDGVHTNLPAVPNGVAAEDVSGDIIGISTGTAGLYYPADKITTLLTATSGS